MSGYSEHLRDNLRDYSRDSSSWTAGSPQILANFFSFLFLCYMAFTTVGSV